MDVWQTGDNMDVWQTVEPHGCVVDYGPQANSSYIVCPGTEGEEEVGHSWMGLQELTSSGTI